MAGVRVHRYAVVEPRTAQGVTAIELVTGCGSTVEPRCRIADRRSSITM
jgi:hypothetical protein